jgi:hypothetical protein
VAEAISDGGYLEYMLQLQASGNRQEVNYFKDAL